MTFYWWSHWFWITCLSAQLLPNAITPVHTYPSQEIGQQQPEERDPSRSITKLYQTTSSLAWSTAMPAASNIMDLTLKPLSTPIYTSEQLELDEAEGEDDVELPLATQDVTVPADELDDDVELTLARNQNEFKRSAEFVAALASSLSAEQLNNYTNFSSSISTNTSNSSITTTKDIGNVSSSTSQPTTTASISSSSSGSGSSPTTTTPSVAAVTSSVTSAPLHTSSSASGAVAATPSTPKINTEWLMAAGSADDLQKAPFTLENANKEEELRRAENEHRSRKSKVLSAEYKHINRYINFSSDTKTLLTRSASAAPNVAGYDGDESNISSEALAIQRTYFLDAGAISAICFTVFGICCTVGTIGIVLYRRRYLNKPQALSEPDSSVYIDDSTMRVSDNSDEMYSLDNDSFLNSLEAMTIQNYWTDTVKHTKL